MENDVFALGERIIRGTDTNSLLRLYDLAREVSNTSDVRLKRSRADKAIERIAKELDRRKVPFRSGQA
jgi:hypothetical protein